MKDFERNLKNVNKLAKSREAVDWFRDSTDELIKRKRNDPNKVFQKESAPRIGSMFLFVYDPKTKDKLPYWDIFPLVIPIEMYSDGFLGLNLHYLPYLARSQLMRALLTVVNNDKYNDSTKLQVSYELLNRYANQFTGYQICLKRYLYRQVRSSFHMVYPADWGKVAILPLQKWQVNPNSKIAGNPPY